MSTSTSINLPNLSENSLASEGQDDANTPPEIANVQNLSINDGETPSTLRWQTELIHSVQKKEIPVITQKTEFFTLITKLRTRYNGEYHRCIVFDHIDKQAADELGMEILHFSVDKGLEYAWAQSYRSKTLSELEGFIDWYEKRSRHAHFGTSNEQSLCNALKKVRVKALREYLNTTEDSSLLARTVVYIGEIMGKLRDHGYNHTLQGTIVLESRDSFYKLTSLIVKGFTSHPEEKEVFTDIQQSLTRRWINDQNAFDDHHGNIYPLMLEMLEWAKAATKALEVVTNMGILKAVILPHYNDSHSNRKKKEKDESQKQSSGHDSANRKRAATDPAVSNTAKRPKVECTVCGREHAGGASECRFRSHPQANLTSSPWASSPNGLRFKNKSFDVLPSNKQLDANDNIIDYMDGKGMNPNTNKSKYHKKVISRLSITMDPSIINSNYSFRGDLQINSNPDANIIGVSVLLDSGAEGGCYIHTAIASKLSRYIQESTEPHSVIVASGEVLDLYKYILCSLKIKLSLNSIIINELYLKNLKLNIMDNLPTEIIIGLPTIREYNLTRVFARYFTSNIDEAQGEHVLTLAGDVVSEACDASETMLVANDIGVQPIGASTHVDDKQHSQVAVETSAETSQHVLHPNKKQNRNPAGINQLNATRRLLPKYIDYDIRRYRSSLLSSIKHIEKPTEVRIDTGTDKICFGLLTVAQKEYITFDKSEFLSEEEELEYEGERLEVYPQPQPQLVEVKQALHELVHIEGPESLRRRVIQLLMNPRYQKCFRETTSKHAALLDPMHLDVDKQAWESCREARLPARVQSLLRQQAIDEFIKQAIRDDMITPSTAPAWSQLFLTPKKNGDFRICIDYRMLNRLTKRMQWPIPRIDEMLRYIGTKRPNFFAVFDLTSGYFQCPISESSQEYTTFTTPYGNYKWKRLPMGLSNAPAHFMQQMQSRVFPDMIHQIMEIYMDDLLTWASTEDEFIERLQLIFERLLQFGLTLNPRKCKFGMSSVEYVGHMIDKQGLHFTPEKLSKVLNFETPRTHSDMRSFLGLCTYFSSHVDHFTELTHELRKAIQPFRKNAKINWTQQLKESYDKLREAVGNCPALSFPSGTGDIVCETDASDYGIGAALFEVSMENGREIKKPLAFMSKQLTGAELRWSTIEKEAYAIFKALTKWEFILRDIPFLLRTDHRNLTFLDTDFRGKVQRWKLAIQSFNFKIQWVKGEENILADQLSRKLRRTPVPEGQEAPNSTATMILSTIRQPLMDHYSYFRGEISRKGFTEDINAYSVMGKYHNSKVGHVGVEKTLARLQEAGYTWPRIRSDVTRFVRACPACQKMRQLKTPITTNPYTMSTYYPMDRLNIDTIGPLPPDEQGYKHIIVIIDSFTRFIELYKARSTTAIAAAEAILQHIGRYGNPLEILTDRGTQYKNEIVATLNQELGIESSYTAPYSHEENGIVERSNKEVMRHLRAIIFDSKIIEAWSKGLPIVQRIMNTQVHSSLGVSPAQLLFGNALRVDRDMFQPREATPTLPRSRQQYVDELIALQDTILRVAAAHQAERDQFQLMARKKANTSRRTEFPINSYVLYTNPSGSLHKLATPMSGPYRVVNCKRSNWQQDNEIGDLYTIQHPITHDCRDVSVHHLQPFVLDAEYVNPAAVATSDHQEFFIEEVIGHDPPLPPSQFIKLKKHQMRFLVRYIGYDKPEYNTWDAMRKTEHLHQYLIANGMKALVPPQFRVTVLRRIIAHQIAEEDIHNNNNNN